MANEGRIDPIEEHAFGPEAGGTPRKIAKTDSTASEEAQSQLLGTPVGTGSGSRQAPLSATERVLNHATRSPRRGRSNPPSHAASPAAKAAPTPVQDDVTAQLRRLAEGDAAPRAVLVGPAMRKLAFADPAYPPLLTLATDDLDLVWPIDLRVARCQPWPRGARGADTGDRRRVDARDVRGSGVGEGEAQARGSSAGSRGRQAAAHVARSSTAERRVNCRTTM